MEPVEVKTPAQIGPYVLRGTIGEGAFSVVKLCYHQKESKYYACKIIPKSRIRDNNLEKRFETEIRIDQQLHHPGIVGLIEIMKDDANCYLIMEFCPNGELFQYIVDRKKLTEDEAKTLILQVMDTVKYIHSMGVTHRDLKPENILVDQVGHLKISDFGLSRFVGKNNLVTTPCGSPCYASPECISGKAYNGKTNDVWSVGVILYAMVTGQLPWTKRNQTQLFEQIKKGEYSIPSYVSKGCCDLIRKLMTVDCKKRITLSNAMSHPWFADAKSAEITPTTQKVISLKKVDEFFCRNVSFDNHAIDISANVRRHRSTRALNFDGIMRQIRKVGSPKNRKAVESDRSAKSPVRSSKPLKVGTKEDTIKALENARRATLQGNLDLDRPLTKPLSRSISRKSDGQNLKRSSAVAAEKVSVVSQTPTKIVARNPASSNSNQKPATSKSNQMAPRRIARK